MSASAPVLIFPGGMPRSLAYLDHCRRHGLAAIGASSLAYDTAQAHYPAWLQLPYVHAPQFAAALRAQIQAHGVRGIFTPHPVVWSELQRLAQQGALPVPLLNPWPLAEELAPFHAAQAEAARCAHWAPELASSVAARPPLAPGELVALLRHAHAIPGMCDNDKIAALASIARHAVAGDVVEIGSAYGKSAFVLHRLARLYGIGPTLCVDPWSGSAAVQHDAGGLVDACLPHYDYEEMLRAFEAHLLPYAAGDLNYLRLPSVEAAARYRQQRTVASAAFGRTHYCGRIALLHIDGNHSAAAVAADVAAWTGYLAPGGWLILDDYRWPFGDGPRLAGDAWLAAHAARLAAAFVMGGALFIQLQ
ncbi:class I SAM-dependent methyltransferase [Massilia sp. MB5]|uniref:class I SAM-dependent methyltransferase n=1 Tax=Massilia sp. MB5 TaxID=2919578 RepID=UPI001F0D0E43|nr:class I SAM-dependent methyltransferase [Massilia sp. MB5]UMR29866.1 class I SAM-dependent methyltransferase [Massilia sp. MB5]